jgi:DNA-binding response OmpR family regulator
VDPYRAVPVTTRPHASSRRPGNETNYLRVHFAHIRRKLEPNPPQPRYFITEAGMGYRFENPPT